MEVRRDGRPPPAARRPRTNFIVMRHLLFVLVFACMGAEGARADLVIAVDKSQQRMLISVDGQDRYNWPISTARAGYSTPNGVYHPEHLARRWFSRQYYGSPMPPAVFFPRGFSVPGRPQIFPAR